MTYRDNGAWGIDDRTGFKIRLSDLKREWTGLRVADPDRRHPQEFVRGVADKQSVPDPRPEPADVFLEPGDVTADSL